MAREEWDDPTEAELETMFGDVEAPMSKGEVVPTGRPPQGHALASGATMLVRDKVVLSHKVGLPRDDVAIMKRLALMAAYAGDEVLMYRWPVKNRRTGKIDTVEGLTIKAAMVLLREYSNADTDILEADRGGSWIFKVYFNDYERGVSTSRLFKQYKGVAKIGGVDDARREDMGYQIGQSKAVRNVIINYLEIPYGRHLEDEARKNLVAKVGKDPKFFRDKIVERLGKLDVAVNRVERVIGRAIGEWTNPEIARVIMEIKAVQDNMVTAADQWPSPAPPEPRRSDAPETPPPSSAAADASPPAAAGAAAATSGPSPHEEAGVSPPAAGSPPSSSAPEPEKERNWTLPPSVVGQDAVIVGLDELLELVASAEDFAQFEHQNADRIAKITGLKGEGLRARINARRRTL